jgi:uncharacterized protein (DUF2336 family)
MNEYNLSNEQIDVAYRLAEFYRMIDEDQLSMSIYRDDYQKLKAIAAENKDIERLARAIYREYMNNKKKTVRIYGRVD